MHRTNRVSRVPLGALLVLGLSFCGYRAARAGANQPRRPRRRRRQRTLPARWMSSSTARSSSRCRPDPIPRSIRVSAPSSTTNRTSSVSSPTGIRRSSCSTGLAPGTATLQLTSPADPGKKLDEWYETVTVNVLVDIEALSAMLARCGSHGGRHAAGRRRQHADPQGHRGAHRGRQRRPRHRPEHHGRRRPRADHQRHDRRRRPAGPARCRGGHRRTRAAAHHGRGLLGPGQSSLIHIGPGRCDQRSAGRLADHRYQPTKPQRPGRHGSLHGPQPGRFAQR